MPSTCNPIFRVFFIRSLLCQVLFYVIYSSSPWTFSLSSSCFCFAVSIYSYFSCPVLPIPSLSGLLLSNLSIFFLSFLPAFLLPTTSISNTPAHVVLVSHHTFVSLQSLLLDPLWHFNHLYYFYLYKREQPANSYKLFVKIRKSTTLRFFKTHTAKNGLQKSLNKD